MTVSVSKAEFIDVIRGLSAVAKKGRAIYRNLEALQKERYIIYKNRNLRLSKKGYLEYERIRKDINHMNAISSNIEAKRIKFKRKQQTKLR